MKSKIKKLTLVSGLFILGVFMAFNVTNANTQSDANPITVEIQHSDMEASIADTYTFGDDGKCGEGKCGGEKKEESKKSKKKGKKSSEKKKTEKKKAESKCGSECG